jgi:hypothetical protein
MTLSPIAALLLKAAHAIAPKQDKVWLEDMRLEAPFVPNQLSFALAGLKLAFAFRMGTWRLNTPLGITFASFALAALAALLFVPRVFLNQPATNATMSMPASEAASSSESVQDIATERGISADAQQVVPPAPNAAITSLPEPQVEAATPEAQGTLQATDPAQVVPQTASDAAEVPQDPEQESLAQAANDVPEPLAAVPVPLPTPTSASNATDQLDETSGPTSPAESAATATSSSTEVPASPEPIPDVATAKQPATASVPTPTTPSANSTVLTTQVKEVSVKLEVVTDAFLTVYNGSDFSGTPRVNRQVTSRESFTFNVPFSLYIDKASALRVTADDSSFTLGETNEEQYRVFTKP